MAKVTRWAWVEIRLLKKRESPVTLEVTREIQNNQRYLCNYMIFLNLRVVF